MGSSLLTLGVRDILGLYKSGKLSPVEMTQACLKQIVKYNPVLNAVCFLDEQSALRQAKSSEKRWKDGSPKGTLDGLPVTLKDWFDVKGWPTRYGSKTSGDMRQPEDSPCVARLREDGAVLLAKTTLPEFGHKGVTDSPLTGITRNPWNVEKTCGGSSGGAAVAAVTGMAPLNLGSDAGGSIRIPASFSGCVGFKPSPGIVPSWPPSVFSSLSALGPLARSVEDAAFMLDTVCRPDARDWNALPIPAPSFTGALKKPLPKLRVAYATSIAGFTTSKDVLEVFGAKEKVFSALGTVEAVELRCPSLSDVFIRHWIALASRIAADIPRAQRKLMDPRFMFWAQRGESLSLSDYVDAERERMMIGAYFKGILDSYDVLVMPTVPMAAFDAGRDMPADWKGGDIWTPFTLPANLGKLPAASLPLGMTKAGLPVGVQVIGGYLKDALVMQAAQRLEQEIAFESWLGRNL